MSDEVSAPSVDTGAPVDSGTEQVSAPAPKPKKTFLDLDGEQVDLDEVKRDRKKWRGADGKFREAAEMRKEHDEFLKDPESYLNNRKLPLDKRKIAEKWLRESIEEELMDPREREHRDREAQLNEYKTREEEAKQREQKERQEAFRQERRETIAKTLGDAMALSPLSKDPEVASETLREMAMYMRICQEQGHKPDAKEIADHVQSKRFKSYGAVANALEGEELISFLGEAIVAKMRKADLARLRQSREQPETIKSEAWSGQSTPQQSRFIDPRQALIKK